MALTDNLVAFWELDNVNDATGLGNGLTNAGSLSFSGGKVGNAVVSNGSSYLTCADNASLSIADIDFTVAAWVYLTGNSASQGCVTKWHATGTQAFEYQLVYRFSTNRMAWQVGSGGITSRAIIDASTFGAPPLNTWMFIVCGHDATANTAWICVNDGTVNSAATSGATGNSNATFGIGGNGGTTAQVMASGGMVDQAGLWKRRLTSTEITQLYNGGAGLSYAAMTGPVAPTLTSVAPSSGYQGTTVPGVLFTGADFVNGATTINVSGSGVSVGTISHTGTTQMFADLTIGGSATVGARTVTVTTANGTSGSQSFTVAASLDLTTNLIGHWPMDESTALATAIDIPGTMDLTMRDNGGGNDGQWAIDGTPARDLERDSTSAFSSASGTAIFTTDQAFTGIVRYKVESMHATNQFFGIIQQYALTARPMWFVEQYRFTTDRVSFRVRNPALTLSSSCEYNLGGLVTLGNTYIVAFGHDPVGDKIWIRVNSNARVELAWTTGLLVENATLNVGDYTPTANDVGPSLDGAIGPVSLWGRSLTDAEIDYWIGVKGNYAAIGGIVSGGTRPVSLVGAWGGFAGEGGGFAG